MTKNCEGLSEVSTKYTINNLDQTSEVEGNMTVKCPLLHQRCPLRRHHYISQQVEIVFRGKNLSEIDKATREEWKLLRTECIRLMMEDSSGT